MRRSSPWHAAFDCTLEIDAAQPPNGRRGQAATARSTPARTSPIGCAKTDVDTVTLVGYMTNNCVLASAVEAEFLGFTTEVLSDATGAINLANDAGFATLKQCTPRCSRC